MRALKIIDHIFVALRIGTLKLTKSCSVGNIIVVVVPMVGPRGVTGKGSGSDNVGEK